MQGKQVKTDSAAMVHQYLGMLAYWLVATIRHQLKQQGINSDWRKIVRTMNTTKCVTTSLINVKNIILILIKIFKFSETVLKLISTSIILSLNFDPFTKPEVNIVTTDQMSDKHYPDRLFSRPERRDGRYYQA